MRILRWMALAAVMGLSVWTGRGQPVPIAPTPVLDLMGVRSIRNSNDALLSSSFGTNVIWVSTTGSDAFSGFSNAFPCLTVSNALRGATSGVSIYCGAGRYNLGTNQICLPNGVNLFGAGSGLNGGPMTEFFGYADCAGVEDGLVGTGGPQIHPGNGSRLQGFTVTCDTNAMLAAFQGSPGHSGTWSGIGVSAANPPANGCFTNASAYDVRVRYGYFDAWHFNSSNYISFYAERCVGESQGDCVNVVIGAIQSLSQETVPNLSSSIVFKDCWFTNDPTDAVNSSIGTGNPQSILSYDRQVTFVNCYGFGTNFTAVTAAGPFSYVNNSAPNFTNPQPHLILQGGNYQCPAGTYWPSNCHGQASFNGVSFYNGQTNFPSFYRGVQIQTNFVSGKIYTNFYGNTIEPRASVMFTNTATSAQGSMQLWVVGVNDKTLNFTNTAGATFLVTAAATNFAVLSGEVPPGYTYTFTNTSAGGAAASTILNGQLIVY